MNNIFYLKALQKLYIAYFNRPGDPSGMNYWLSTANQSSTFRDISRVLSKQEEYIKYADNQNSIESKIDQLYLNLFNRKTDSEGLNYWMKVVESKNYNISDIVYEILYEGTTNYISSPEQKVIDRQILNNKVFAAEIFTNQIRKSITLINLYQPEAISPWNSGESFSRVTRFIDKVSDQKVSVLEVNDVIGSMSGSSIMLTQEAMDMKDISLSIPIDYIEDRSLSKKFATKVINITGGQLTQSKKGTNIIALNHISLTIMKGERVGLIGHNGSGKSSFLKLISGIYSPSTGTFRSSVDIYPMLQKTFLTSPELSGIDACKAYFLLKNNSLEGFEPFLNEIVEFSGLGSYISLPVKTYSEGMSARLIFSILTSSPHDCLAIDEGFGTGDAEFFDRAEKRMEQFVKSAATLFLASHSEDLLRKFCNRGILFKHGSIAYDGPLDDALNYYHSDDYHRKNVI